jgi:hypothetical protein
VQTREQLEKRVAELESQMAAMQQVRGRRVGIRKRASWELLGLPFYDIAAGPDWQKGERMGHARGFIAIGDIATGVIAIGGLARGAIALGGLALGVVSLGGLSVGLGAALGGLAISAGIAFGGGALGGVAVGGGAVGYYACGGAAAGAHAVSAISQDPEGVAFFREHGMDCTARNRGRYRY